MSDLNKFVLTYDSYIGKGSCSEVISSNVSGISDKSFKGNGYIECVKAGAGIRKIGKQAFDNAKELSVFQIGDASKGKGGLFIIGFKCSCIADVASDADDMLVVQYQAFNNCQKLVSVILNVNARVKIEKEAFRNCVLLETVLISDKNAVIASDAFAGCSNLTIIAPEGGEAETYARCNGISFLGLK